MKETFISIANKQVTVGYVLETHSVMVHNVKDGQVKVFGGWQDIKEEFDLFVSSFGFTVTYQDAIDFFKPNIANKVIAKP